MGFLERVLLTVFDHWSRRPVTTGFTEITPQVHLVGRQSLQVFGSPPKDLQPDMAVIGFLRREMSVHNRK